MRTASAYNAFIDTLTATVEARDDALGLVLLGSTADRDRADEWSDHDFFLVTADGAQERYRTDLSWLPNAAELALTVRETEHGLKAVYDDGHVLEFAVFSFEELLLAEANAWAVAADAGGIAERMAEVAARPKPNRDPAIALGLFLSLLLIGVGRARRGETLTAGQSVRSHALAQLLTAIAREVPAEHSTRLDSLDPFRRFEQVYPELGATIGAALERDVERAARDLLDIAEQVLGHEPSWPTRGVVALRSRLGWH